MEGVSSPVVGPMPIHPLRIKQLYQTSNSDTEGKIKIVQSPFKVLKFSDFIDGKSYMEKLTEDVLGLHYERKDNDLYSLSQTTDLSNENIPSICKFLSLLKNDIQPLLSKVMSIQFNGKISVTASLYQKGDMLLCHDDKCDDRCVAFVFYLTGGKPGSGGAFEMFGHDEKGQPTTVTVSIPVVKNSFLCFEVGNLSYHQVAEITDSSFKRLSINGWFHSDKAFKIIELEYKDPMPEIQEQVILEGLVMLDEFLNLSYCTPSNLLQFRETFEDDSQILLQSFLIPTFYELCADALKDESISWKIIGPANRRKYEVADELTLPVPLTTLCNLLKSPLFVSYFRNATGLSLEPLMDPNLPQTGLVFELQRWRSGSYSMVTDNDEFFEKAGLDVYLFFCADEALTEKCSPSGYITYLAADGDADESELLTLVPASNSLCMVYRTNDTVRFTKYINSSVRDSYYCISATYFEPEEIS